MTYFRLPMEYHQYDKNGEATLMRGFAQQIIMLKKPTLGVVQDIGAGIGLMILKKQQYDQLITESKAAADVAEEQIAGDHIRLDQLDEIIEKLRFALICQIPDEQKIALINKVLNETIS